MNAFSLEERITILARWIFESKKLVAFTGAGISTASGIRDFRGPDGLWTREEQGLETPHQDISHSQPNAGHLALVEMQNLGKLDFLISQNVDNLHLKSGIRPELLAELHGNLTKVRCQRCEFPMDNFDDLSICPECGGNMEPSVVDFGQALPQKVLAEATLHAQNSDLFVVAGSSLVVYPAADIPRVAVESGAKLIIINRGETPLDNIAHLKFEEAIGNVLPNVVNQVKNKLRSGMLLSSESVSKYVQRKCQ
jgi:NAD-dependent deacetylase